MRWLLDTNVISELRRKAPASAVLSWIEERAPSSLYLSVLTLGEIRKGVELLDDSARRQRLTDWLDGELPAWFDGRILPIDAGVAHRWGCLQAQARRPLAAIDSLLAATALAHDLTLVTRNVRDFAGLSVRLVDPWERAG